MGRWSVGNANALYRGERPRLHYKTKSNVQLAWRFSRWRGRGWGPLGRSRARRRRLRDVRRGRGTTLTRESNVGRERHGQVETSLGGDTAGGGLKGDRKVIPLQILRGESSEGSKHRQAHVTIQTLPASANLPRKVATPLKMKAGHWRLGETAHLPEVSLFERFLSRARGVRPNRSTRTRRGLARRGGPTYSVIESFRDFWGCPIADLHYRRR